MHCEALLLGHSVTEGLYRYKTKWGGAILNAPYHHVMFSRKDFPVLQNVSIGL